MASKLKHEFGAERQCIHCELPVKTAAATARDEGVEFVRLLFVGGINDGMRLLMQFPVDNFSVGDHYVVSRGERVHVYEATRWMRLLCGIRQFYVEFQETRAAR